MHRTPVFIDEQQFLDDFSLSSISFYIMFNLSLTQHLKALGNEGDDSRRTEQVLIIAKRLYELTLHQSQRSACDLILVAAMLNNLSVVHNALKEKEGMVHCLKLLVSTLSLLRDVDRRRVRGESSLNATRGEVSSADILDGFMGNVIHLMMSDSSVAPCA